MASNRLAMAKFDLTVAVAERMVRSVKVSWRERPSRLGGKASTEELGVRSQSTRARRAEDGRILKERCLQCWWSPRRMQLKNEDNTEEKVSHKVTWVPYIDLSRSVVARKLGKKGVVTIVPFSGGKGAFFFETTEEALFLQDLRNLRVKGRISVQMRRWSPKENAEIEGKFRGAGSNYGGCHFISGLSKARVRIAMKDRSVLPALLEVTDGDWVFTVAVVVVGEEDFSER
ncbi:hypothetical protein CK203_028108 [Vitis vinifera]|uniref:DUF4283 domain-containing protein n=1 Tax=Vitis vinifera TaxID=29760 RepID=A0A438ILX9_VITVI|nr:hypothetical protein CK203_028108 [Vitis vinifera]